MIKAINFLFGSKPKAPPLSFGVTTLTIFVGPNNSGNSLVLREIENSTASSSDAPPFEIIQTIIPEQVTAEAAACRLKLRAQGDVSDTRSLEILKYLPNGSTESRYLDLSAACQGIGKGDARLTLYLLVWLSMLRLDGGTRLELVSPQSQGDLIQPPRNHLAALFVNDASRQRMREITNDAFGLFFVIDALNSGQLRVRLSKRAPSDTQEERSLDQRSRDFHAAAKEITEFSDGVKAYTGISAAVLSSDYKVILIDEPQRLLYPALRENSAEIWLSRRQEWLRTFLLPRIALSSSWALWKVAGSQRGAPHISKFDSHSLSAAFFRTSKLNEDSSLAFDWISSGTFPCWSGGWRGGPGSRSIKR